MTTTHTHTAHEVARAWGEAIAERDWDVLAQLVSHDVAFLEATPRGAVELHGRDALVEYAKAGFGGADSVVTEAADGAMIGDGVRAVLRLRVTSDGQSWLFDQTLYLTLDSDSRACTISAACSGGQLA